MKTSNSLFENYYKLELPVNRKKSTKGYKYSGIAYYVFERKTNVLVFNSMKITSTNVVGCSSWKDEDGDPGFLESYPKLKEWRKKCFTCESVKHNKPISPLLVSIDEFNTKIFKNKLTVKNTEGFIINTKPSGGVKNPKADPLNYEGQLNIDMNIKEWKIMSMFSSKIYKGVKHNNDFHLINSWNDLERISTIKLEEFINNDEIKIKTKFNTIDGECYTPTFKEMFISRNGYQLKNNKILDQYLNFEFIDKETEREFSFVDKILTLRFKGQDYYNNQLRYQWNKKINTNIKNHNYKRDFVLGRTSFDRAHIIEHSVIMKKTMYEKNMNIAEDELSKLFLEENYLLLDKTTHNDWDKGKVKIKPNGKFKNISLSKEEFNKYYENENIYDIYNNIMSSRRRSLLSERYTSS